MFSDISRWIANSPACVESDAACDGTVCLALSCSAVVIMFRPSGLTRGRAQGRQLGGVAQQIARQPLASLAVPGQGILDRSPTDRSPRLRRTFLGQGPQIIALGHPAGTAGAARIAWGELSLAVATLAALLAITAVHSVVHQQPPRR